MEAKFLGVLIDFNVPSEGEAALAILSVREQEFLKVPDPRALLRLVS